MKTEQNDTQNSKNDNENNNNNKDNPDIKIHNINIKPLANTKPSIVESTDHTLPSQNPEIIKQESSHSNQSLINLNYNEYNFSNQSFSSQNHNKTPCLN